MSSVFSKKFLNFFHSCGELSRRLISTGGAALLCGASCRTDCHIRAAVFLSDVLRMRYRQSVCRAGCGCIVIGGCHACAACAALLRDVSCDTSCGCSVSGAVTSVLRGLPYSADIPCSSASGGYPAALCTDTTTSCGKKFFSPSLCQGDKCTNI